MIKPILTLIMACLAVTACTSVPIEKRTYHQDEAFIQKYAQLYQGKTAHELAKIASDETNAKTGGKSIILAPDLVQLRVFAENEFVVYQYVMGQRSKFALNNMQRAMTNDLLSRTCNIPTVRMAFRQGMKEKHHYLFSDEKTTALMLVAGEDECKRVGL